MIPGGVELFAFEAALFGAVPFQEVERQPPQRGQILGRMPHPCPASVLAALHVQHPVPGVLDGPMAPHGPRQFFHVHFQAAQGVAALDREAKRRSPTTGGYSAAGPVIQADILRQLDAEHSAFFEVIRTATIQGMFSHPEYGGNRDKIGWKLIGFEDRFVWQEPFGDYDR